MTPVALKRVYNFVLDISGLYGQFPFWATTTFVQKWEFQVYVLSHLLSNCLVDPKLRGSWLKNPKGCWNGPERITCPQRPPLSFIYSYYVLSCLSHVLSMHTSLHIPIIDDPISQITLNEYFIQINIHLLPGLAKYFAFPATARALISKRIEQLDCVIFSPQLWF